MPIRCRISAAVAAAFVLGTAGAARADAIDGHWCFTDGRSVSIDGPNIITPGGQKSTGDYDRHGFDYVVPAGETGAGTRVVMNQMDDEHITVQEGEAKAKIWRRCARPTS